MSDFFTVLPLHSKDKDGNDRYQVKHSATGSYGVVSPAAAAAWMVRGAFNDGRDVNAMIKEIATNRDNGCQTYFYRLADIW